MPVLNWLTFSFACSRFVLFELIVAWFEKCEVVFRCTARQALPVSAVLPRGCAASNTRSWGGPIAAFSAPAGRKRPSLAGGDGERRRQGGTATGGPNPAYLLLAGAVAGWRLSSRAPRDAGWWVRVGCGALFGARPWAARMAVAPQRCSSPDAVATIRAAARGSEGPLGHAAQGNLHRPRGTAFTGPRGRGPRWAAAHCRALGLACSFVPN